MYSCRPRHRRKLYNDSMGEQHVVVPGCVSDAERNATGAQRDVLVRPTQNCTGHEAVSCDAKMGVSVACSDMDSATAPIHSRAHAHGTSPSVKVSYNCGQRRAGGDKVDVVDAVQSYRSRTESGHRSCISTAKLLHESHVDRTPFGPTSTRCALCQACRYASLRSVPIHAYFHATCQNLSVHSVRECEFSNGTA